MNNKDLIKLARQILEGTSLTESFPEDGTKAQGEFIRKLLIDNINKTWQYLEGQATNSKFTKESALKSISRGKVNQNGIWWTFLSVGDWDVYITEDSVRKVKNYEDFNPGEMELLRIEPYTLIFVFA